MGARVTAVDNRIKEDMLRRTGADRFIDYTREDFTKGDQQYDVIFDMVAGSSYSACIRSLKPDGRYLKGNPRLSDMVRAVATTRFTRRTATYTFARETVEELLTLKEMIDDTRIKPVIDRIYPPDQAGDAHRRVETEQRVGIVVISMQGWLNG
jgi:NADPH:quinone reductase-like Zn-dependent oxidoreductase